MAKQAREFPAAPDDFEFALIPKFAGYNSSGDPSLLPAGTLVQGSVNTYRKNSGVIANRCGKLLYDAAADTTIAGILSGFVWNTSLATQYPLRCANGKLEVESAVTGTRAWYTLLSGLTLTRFVFDSYWDNTDKKDTLVMVNGGTNVYDWSGGFALFVSATPTVITLNASAATSGFASSGTVTINGTDYTYTGISGSTLTGVGTDASGEAANSVVMQKINTTANSSLTSGPSTEFVNDFIRVINNQLYLGSYTSRLHYISKNSSFKDFSKSTPRLTGEGDVLTLDDVGKGIGVRQGTAHIFGGTSNLYIISFNQITVGSVLAEQTKVDKIQLGEQSSAQAHEFIDVLSDNLIYLDQANQVREYGTFRNLATSRPAMLSFDVQDELHNTDFTNGQLKVVGDFNGDNIYIIAPNSAYVFWLQQRTQLSAYSNVTAERIWQPPQIWAISRMDVIGSQVIGFSNSNPQIYQLWETGQWADDAPDGQVSYNSIALFAYQNGGRRQGKVVFDKTYIEGYCTQGTSMYLGLYFDYQGSTTLLSLTISNVDQRFSSSQLFTGIIPPSLGDASLGNNPLGDGLNTALDDHFTMPKFRTIIGSERTDCFEFAPMIFSQDAGDRWEIITFGMNLHESEYSAVEVVQ